MLRASCIFVADGGKKRAARGGFARSRALGLPGAGHGLASLSGRINEETEWCFVRWLQFGRNLEELAHGVRPGHADILVLEHEEIAIPRPGLCLSFFRNKSRIAFLQQCASINYVRKVDVISAT